jgi:hypothetical protein
MEIEEVKWMAKTREVTVGLKVIKEMATRRVVNVGLK